MPAVRPQAQKEQSLFAARVMLVVWPFFSACKGLLAATDIEEHLCCLRISLLLPSIKLLRSEGRLIRRLCRPLWGSTRHHAGQAEVGTASAASLTAAEQALMQGPVLC